MWQARSRFEPVMSAFQPLNIRSKDTQSSSLSRRVTRALLTEIAHTSNMSTLPLLILLAASCFGFARAETGKEIHLAILLHPHFASFQLNAIPTTTPKTNRRTPPVSDSGNMMAKSMKAARIQATQRMDCGVRPRQTLTWNTQNGATATWKLTRATQKVCKALS